MGWCDESADCHILTPELRTTETWECVNIIFAAVV